MPRLIDVDTTESCEPRDLIEALEKDHFDPEDEESLAAFAPLLRRLANNRRFLGDLAVEEVKARCSGQVARNAYSAQVILLHHVPGRFAIRANFWPAEGDSVVVSSGKAPFFYGVPHDHNFSFLTVGYLGPGYWSDYFEYDYDRVVGHVGEKVDLRFVERSRLSQGKMLLYRKHRDVHSQLPPDAVSVSLNILALSHRSDFLDQYGFDAERSEITGLLNPSSLENLVALAGAFGGGNGLDLVESFARSHPSDRVRFAAWRAKAARSASVGGRLAVYGAAAAASNPYVRAMAAREADRLRACRHLMDRDPAFTPA